MSKLGRCPCRLKSNFGLAILYHAFPGEKGPLARAVIGFSLLGAFSMLYSSWSSSRRCIPAQQWSGTRAPGLGILADSFSF